MRWVKGNLNIVNLRTFQTVIETGSHTAAAKKLGYTTSAVSQQIAALEKAVGVELFERGPRSLWPTPAGLAMSTHADVILRQVARVEDEMQTFASGSQGSLRIGASGTAAAALVPRALSRLAMRYASAEISVDDIGLQKMADAVLEGVVDLGILYEYGKVPLQRTEGLVFNPILDEELVVISSARSTGTTTEIFHLEDFAQERWITNEVGTSGTENFLHVCRESGFEPNVGFYSNDFDVIRGLVKETLGIALVPALALGIDRGISMHRLSEPAPRRIVHVLHRASDNNPLLAVAMAALRDAAEVFIDWTRDAFEIHLDSPVATIVTGPSSDV